MNNNNLVDALSHLDHSLIEEAAQPVVRHKTRFRSALVAACLCLLIAIPAVAVTGNLLVEHYYGSAIPKNLSEQNLDTFFRANSMDKIPVSALSQQVLDTAAVQEEAVGHYGFETLEDAEAFLGLDLLNSNEIHAGYPVSLTDTAGNQILETPCHLTLLRGEEGLLYAINLQYYFQNSTGTLISLTANAVTDQNPNDNNSSIGVSNDSAAVLQQNSASYQMTDGSTATIISTQYSNGHGWNIDSWMQENGFVIRFSLSATNKEEGIQTIQKLLQSLQ